jgi:dipeptidyl aminopeptidase/acylaminoacyl peptidase
MTCRIVLCVLATLVAAASSAATRGFTVDDLVRLERVGAPVLSPDGDRVVYTVRETDMDQNRGHTELWSFNLKNPAAAPQRLTRSEASNTNPQWSPGGDAIYFLSTRSGTSQVWRLPLSGGEAVPVTALPLDVGTFRVSPRGNRLALTIEVFRDCQTIACTKQRLDDQGKLKATGRSYDRLLVRHWDAWANGRRFVLYTLPLGPDGRAIGEPLSLSGTLDGDVPSRPFGDQADYRFSPDGATIVFSIRVAGREEAWSTNFDLYAAASTGGTPRNLTTDNPAWDAQPVFSPDGTTLAYRAMTRPGFEADRFHLVLLDLATGAKRALAEAWDRSVADLSWSVDGRAVYVTADDLGQHPLFRVDVKSGQVTKLTSTGAVTGFDVGATTIVYALQDLGAPAELFAVPASGGRARALTHHTAARLKDVKLGDFEQFSFAGHNGETVYGYVMKPWNSVAGSRYPIAFIIHGGPQVSYANNWSYRWNPQVYAGAGYGVVFIDFHGSPGYGQAFTDSITRDWGGKPLEDLRKGLAAALARYPWLDGGRACALGASYGGYMVNWIAGQWPAGFRCLVNHDGVFDTRAMYYSTEELWFTEWENGGPYYAVPDNYEQFNPVRFVDRWKTPMLVIHGEQDFRLPSTQGISTFTALQRRGVESRFLSFPDENHWVLKPANSVQWHQAVLSWLDAHLSQ